MTLLDAKRVAAGFRRRPAGFTHYYDEVDRPTEIETPPGVAEFLHELISGKYQIETIFDPCVGNGNLTKLWKGRKIWCEIKKGKDFFSCPKRIECDLVLCNPPFTIDGKNGTLRFLERIVEVVPKKTPIALIAPVTFRLDQRKSAKRWRWMRDNCPPISSIISLPRDCFAGVDFYCEVLLFNLSKVKPHYFLPEKYVG